MLQLLLALSQLLQLNLSLMLHHRSSSNNNNQQPASRASSALLKYRRVLINSSNCVSA